MVGERSRRRKRGTGESSILEIRKREIQSGKGKGHGYEGSIAVIERAEEGGGTWKRKVRSE